MLVTLLTHNSYKINPVLYRYMGINANSYSILIFLESDCQLVDTSRI